MSLTICLGRQTARNGVNQAPIAQPWSKRRTPGATMSAFPVALPRPPDEQHAQHAIRPSAAIAPWRESLDRISSTLNAPRAVIRPSSTLASWARQRTALRAFD
jgi:hypothetical protein